MANIKGNRKDPDLIYEIAKTFLLLKKSSPIFHFFFSNLWKFWYHKKALIFSHNPWQILQLKVFRLEDISENLSGNMVTIVIEAYTVKL